eukprot:scaffold30636_cov100-Cyclotella_meneghiniana.AAC.5
MYEEIGASKLQDDITPTITATPNELESLIQRNRGTSDYHYYWTSPIASVMASTTDFQWHAQIQDKTAFLDPRGPSLWMGTAGSGTQCHYDVADNIIVQLYGTKRVRIYHPIVGVNNLHVFPDAHPKARKSQVDFDFVVNGGSDDDEVMRQRFPHYYHDIPSPVLDVTLQPGDAIEIPAFWFHHIENGVLYNKSAGRHEDAPSISLNSFALSKFMMTAQTIFQKASRPLGSGANNVSSGLKELGIRLISSLNIVDDGQEANIIRRYLLEARYHPLINNTQVQYNKATGLLTDAELQTIDFCIERILPDFQALIMAGEKNVMNKNGIVLLVALHLLELWTIELVGDAKYMESIWDDL